MLKYILPMFLLMPFVAYGQGLAQDDGSGGQLGEFLGAAQDFIFGPALYFFIALAFIIFVWGVIKYFISDAEGDKASAKSLMLWGIGGLVLILVLWGAVNMFVDFLGLGGADLDPLPEFERPTN